MQTTKGLPFRNPLFLRRRHDHKTRRWVPWEEKISNANMARFMKEVNIKFGKNLKTYKELYHWSVENIADFCSAIWDFAEIEHSKGYQQVIDDVTKMPGAKWFTGAKLNFAENLLCYPDDQIALIFKGEILEPRRMTYAQLCDQVSRMAKALRDAGVTKGDRVAGFMPNMRCRRRSG